MSAHHWKHTSRPPALCIPAAGPGDSLADSSREPSPSADRAYGSAGRRGPSADRADVRPGQRTRRVQVAAQVPRV